MGIQGLLPFLKKIHTPVNLAQFEGCTVAIDAYCWLHKGAFSCAEKLALGEKTDQYVYYCMKYIDNMLKKNIKPILVFDGCHLPSKREVEKSRREKREVNRKKAAQLLREGKRAEARECLQRCIDISPEMALNLMNTCRARGVDCIVAPYEADAQLAFLNKAGIAQIIITEDSDLLLFGCEKVIFKMDHMGNGLLIEQRRLNEVLEINGAGFTFDKFRYMCILSGCDYLASLPGIGLAKACKVFKMARQDDLKLLLKKFPSTYLKMNLTVTEEYIQGFLQANNTFLHQLVYDPINRELRPLCRYPPGVDSEDFPYAGAISMMSKEHALQVALGNINIYNGEKFAAFDPDQPTNKKSNNKKSPQLHLLSIWDRNYRVRPKGELKETQNIQRPNLKGKEVVVQHNALNWKKKEIVDPDTIRSNHELSTMYEEFPDEKPQVESLTDESIKQISPNTSPRRISPRNSPRRKKRRSSESDDDVKLSPVKKYRKLSQSPQKFLKSLVAANTNSPVKSEEEEEECDKENGFTSPRRNRFALATATNKSRFNINAQKVVKSRFFASPPSEKSSSQDSEKNEEKSHSSMSDEPELQSTNKEDVCQSDSSTLNSSVEKTLKVKKTISDKKTKEESPGSAFNWSKLKSTKKVDSSPESSKITVKSQFKRVVSESNLKQYFSRSASKEEESEERPKFCLGSDEDDNESQETNVSYSQQSNAYSIDSFCMGGSQTISDISESQGSDVCSRLSEIDESVDRRKEHKDDDVDRSSQHSIPEKITRTPTFTSPVSTKKLPGKGCRVSGLSKGKRSKSLASIEDQGKQQTIKNFFSKFAHNKSQPKISINKDESDEVEITSVTPTSTDFNNRTAVNGTQRKILP